MKKNLGRLFWYSVRDGDVTASAELWDEVPANLKDAETLEFLLGEAIRGDHLESLKFLWERGANIDGRGPMKDIGLLAFAMHRKSEKCVEWLLDHVNCINFPTRAAEYQCHALEYACARGNLDIVKRLISMGAVTKYCWYGEPGMDPVGFAKFHGNDELIEILESVDQSVVIASPDFSTFQSHVARYIGYPEIVKTDSGGCYLVAMGRGDYHVFTHGVNQCKEYEYVTRGRLDWPIIYMDEKNPGIASLKYCLDQVRQSETLPCPSLVCDTDISMTVLRENLGFVALAVIPSTRVPAIENELEFREVIPLFPEELELCQTVGLEELQKRLDETDDVRWFDPSRKNVGLIDR